MSWVSQKENLKCSRSRIWTCSSNSRHIKKRRTV